MSQAKSDGTGWGCLFTGVAAGGALGATVLTPQAYTGFGPMTSSPTSIQTKAPSTSHMADIITPRELQAELKAVDAKLEAAEARTDTKFEKLLGSLNVLGEKLDGIGTKIGDLKGDIGDANVAIGRLEDKTNNTRIIIVTTAIAATLTIVGLTYAMIGYGHQVAETITNAFVSGQEAKNDQPQASTGTEQASPVHPGESGADGKPE